MTIQRKVTTLRRPPGNSQSAVHPICKRRFGRDTAKSQFQVVRRQHRYPVWEARLRMLESKSRWQAIVARGALNLAVVFGNRGSRQRRSNLLDRGSESKFLQRDSLRNAGENLQSQTPADQINTWSLSAQRR